MTLLDYFMDYFGLVSDLNQDVKKLFMSLSFIEMKLYSCLTSLIILGVSP